MASEEGVFETKLQCSLLVYTCTQIHTHTSPDTEAPERMGSDVN